VADVELTPTSSTALGRALLHRWCYDRFELENQRLIERLGWPIPAFIPEPGGAPSSDELGDLDAYWGDLAPSEAVLWLAALLDGSLSS
jgi:hypothetical protein